ncbi:unnamed protein product [Calypogeia fissa]
MGNSCLKPTPTGTAPPAAAVQTVQIDGNIKTVVVLVMENRSFDNVLGFLNRVHPNVDGLKGDEYNLVNVSDPNSKKVYISDAEPYVTEADPDHGYDAIKVQVFGGTDTSLKPPPMNGFAQTAEAVQAGFASQVMSAFKPESIPITVALAQEFAVFDKWFASLPCSTQPNRFYVHSATSHGLISNVTADLVDGNPQKTIFENIEEAGLSFGIYYQNIPATLFYSRLRNLKYINNFREFDLDFKNDARNGKLPNYTVIEQRYFDYPPFFAANDNHPPHDVTNGEKLLKEVYETLRQSPQWNELVWVITYDEHGGFYDHVPTPVTGVPNPDGIKGPAPDFFNFDRLGVRVPTVIVSPWIEKGVVVHEATGPTATSQYEHSSICATVKKIFKLPNFLTARDAWAGTFDGVFTSRTTPRTDCPVTLPEAPSSTATVSAAQLNTKTDTKENSLNEWQGELMLLASLLKGEKAATPDVSSEAHALDYVKTAIAAHLKN